MPWTYCSLTKTQFQADLFHKKLENIMGKNNFHPLSAVLPHIIEQYPHPQGPYSPTNPAYVYIAVILESLGKESSVSDVWLYVAQHFTTEDDQTIIARRMREGLLKASVLVGFPRAWPPSLVQPTSANITRVSMA